MGECCEVSELPPSYWFLIPWKIYLVIDWRVHLWTLVSTFVFVGLGLWPYDSWEGAWVSISNFGFVELRVHDEGPKLW